MLSVLAGFSLLFKSPFQQKEVRPDSGVLAPRLYSKDMQIRISDSIKPFSCGIGLP